MDVGAQKSLLQSPYAKEFLSELIRKTESYKFNRAVEELRMLSNSIIELKEIFIALTIAVYVIAILYAISICFKITKKKKRIPKNDVEAQCVTPPYIKTEISRKTSLEDIPVVRNGTPVNGSIMNGSVNIERPSSLKNKPPTTQPLTPAPQIERNKITSSSCKRRQTMVQLLENLEKGNPEKDRTVL